MRALSARQLSMLCSGQDFSEKPKGDALEEMKVDTTLLGACQCQMSEWDLQTCGT